MTDREKSYQDAGVTAQLQNKGKMNDSPAIPVRLGSAIGNLLGYSLAVGFVLSAVLMSEVPAQTATEAPPLLRQLETFSEAKFDSVMMFGLIDIYINDNSGDDAEDHMDLGMDRKEIRQLVMKQFQNNFTGIPYEKMATVEILSLIENRDPKRAAIGFIVVQIDIRPINIDLEGIEEYFLYQITLKSGNFASYFVWENNIATICSKEYGEVRLRGDLRNLMDNLAIDFFKSRGEL
ncbi:MAG TPA: hypothetical protein VKA68_11260 [bacterium]|nr:hypothetical protein [bacterium]